MSRTQDGLWWGPSGAPQAVEWAEGGPGITAPSVLGRCVWEPPQDSAGLWLSRGVGGVWLWFPPKGMALQDHPHRPLPDLSCARVEARGRLRAPAAQWVCTEGRLPGPGQLCSCLRSLCTVAMPSPSPGPCLPRITPQSHTESHADLCNLGGWSSGLQPCGPLTQVVPFSLQRSGVGETEPLCDARSLPEMSSFLLLFLQRPRISGLLG